MNNLFTILFFTLLASPFYSNAQNSTSSIYLDQDLEELEELIDMNLLEDDVYHLFAHGRPGELYLNNEWLSSKEIIEFLQARIIDKAGSNPFSHLNIYACDFGKGKKGARALKELQSIFPQGIAASTNKVGNSNLGGDWEMEVILGSPKNILQIPNWDKTLQITFSFTNNYTNTTTLANFNCAGYTTMDATLIFNSPPLTITFACPITSVSIPMMSLGESNIEMYSFDAVGAPETLSTTCTDVDIVGNTVTNNTGAGGTSGVDFYLTLSSTTPFTQIIVTKLSGTYAAGIMNTGSGYWTDPCITPTPCTTPSACSITGPNTLTTGASGSYSTAAPTPTGTSSSWSITPTTGVSLSSGIGTNTGNLSFANAGTYTLSFTHTNNSNPSSCNPSSSITCSTTITVSSSCTNVLSSSNENTCDSALVNSSWYYTTQTIQDTFPGAAANGCDSIHTTNLTVNNSNSSTDVQIQCTSYTWIDGITYNTSNNSASYSLVNSSGCDSIVFLDLSINNADTTTDILTACDSLTWIDGVTYYTNNNSANVSFVNTNGCDSTVYLNLSLSNSSSSMDIVEACASYTWIDGITYTASNSSASYTLTNSNGCDSVVLLNLTLTAPDTTLDYRFACDSLTWIDGITYTSSNNTASHTIIGGASNGCDSIVALDLQMLYATYGSDTLRSCDSVFYDNNWFTTSQTVQDTFLSNASCDSIASIVILIEANSPDTALDYRFTCDSLTWIDGITYYNSNNTATYTFVGGAANGCDSIVALDLQVLDTRYSNDTLQSCDSVFYNNIWYATSQTFSDTLVSNANCDSIANTVILIGTQASDTAIDFRFACDTFTWIDGITYNSSNNTATYTLVGGASNGCDSVVALNLQMLYTSYSNDTIRGCDSVRYDNIWYATSQTILDTFVSNASCDSIATITIIIEAGSVIPFVEIDTTLCIGETLELDARDFYGNGYSYRWENNTEGPVFQTQTSGNYTLSIIDNNLCEYERVADVNFEDCSSNCIVIVPSAFSPNQDGVNDQLKIFRVCEADFVSWKVRVYNRWGELVFQSNNFTDNWDGTIKGKTAPIGVYTYVIDYTIAGASTAEITKGNVSLIR